MSRNTHQSYGSVARSLHWLTALLILTAIPLGLYANALPFDSATAAAYKFQVFSLHKTLGVTIFFVALVRILWALTQPRPVPLHPERRVETFAAESVHWMLYISLVVVPLSGWVRHAAIDGFAPILWPFGQDLPFIAKSEPLSNAASALHLAFTKLLIAALLLHIAGALKHVFIDRDHTLNRMLRGTPAGSGAHRGTLAPLATALAIYAAGAGIAIALIPPAPETPGAAAAATTGNWQVTEGSLGLTVKQAGAKVTGQFANWNAEIAFDPAASSGNAVTVTIDTASLSLGSVTPQAQMPEFFDVATHPTATFTAEIQPEGDAYAATGSLSLRGVTQPLTLPFTLQIDGDTATMQGSATLDRRDYAMGASYPDEATVGFPVTVNVVLSAKRVN